MSGFYVSKGGGFVSYPVEFVACRWGGGAEHGKTHVFVVGPSVRYSEQCVTDDFGNLVATGGAA